MGDILKSSLFEAFATASDNVYIYVCDLKTDLTRWSENAVDYFNLEGEYIVNTGEKWMSYIHPDDRQAYYEDISAVMAGKSKRHNCQYRAINKYGVYVWLECKGSVVKGHDGESDIFAGMMTRLDNQNKYDPLTGLRTLYDFHQLDFSQTKGALMLVGLDDFRKVVSNHGYNVGDRVLVQFAKALIALDDGQNLLYRFSGDEFLILRPDADEKTMQEMFERIKDRISALRVDEHTSLRVGISGGLTVYPQDGQMRELLINNLEHSLEYSKKNRRGTLTVFSKGIEAMQRRLQTLKEELRASIANDFKGFELYFQPIVNNYTDKITGCEALLRWKGDTIKDSYPMEFISILEASGDIHAVGTWVMEQSLLHQKKWSEKFPGLYVGFNVAYQQFIDKNFIDHTIEFTHQLGLDPENITIELTESNSIDNPQELAEIFRRLKKEGYTLALDDFGTAYASMELLKYLPVNLIKIEHSFVNQLSIPDNKVDYTIISGMLSLCQQLGCESVVEGIETKEVMDIVKTVEPAYLQGYYFSRPIPESEFLRLLEDNYSGRIEF